MKKLLLYIFIASVLLSGSAAIVHAQPVAGADTSKYTLLEPLPCIPGTGNGDCSTNEKGVSVIKEITVDQYIAYIFKFAMALAVFLATVMIIFGGFQWMLSAAPGLKLDGKKKIWNAVTGLAAVLVSYLLLQTIDPRLVQITTTLKPICTAEELKPGGICSKAETSAFQSQLTKDLQRLNSERLSENINLEKEINDLKTQKQALQTRRLTNQNPTDPNYISQEDYEKEVAKLDIKIRDKTSSQVQLVATGSSEAFFKNALTAYHAEGAFKRDGTLVTTNLEANADAGTNAVVQKAAITAVYRKYLGDPIIAGDPIATSKLQFQQKFYTDQIDEEQAFMSAYTKFKNTPKVIDQAVSSGGTGAAPTLVKVSNPKYTEARNEIDKYLNKYKLQNDYLSSDTPLEAKTIEEGKSYRAAELVKKDPILTAQDKTLLQDRINAINKAIAQ